MTKIKSRPSILFSLILLGILVVMMSSCGKKAPPVAPKQPAMPTVTDLAATPDNGRITLSWHHPGTPSPTVGYQVLQAQRALSQPECPGCPLVFQRLGTVDLQRTLRQQRHGLEFVVTQAKGTVYHFKVIPFQSSGAQGPDSNIVKLEVPSQ